MLGMKFLKVILFLILALLCLSGCKNSNTTGDEPVVSISGKVIRVLDGDTVKLMEKGTGQEYTIRLYGIDGAKKYVKDYTDEAIKILSEVGKENIFLNELIISLINREK